MAFYIWDSDPPTLEGWFMQPWCHVLLPQLRSLTLSLPQSPGHDATTAIPYLAQYSRTLTTLSLKPCRFSYEGVSVLLPQLHAVRTLELFVWAISPDLLQLFAKHLPKLHSLGLDGEYYSPEKDTRVIARVPKVGG